MTFEQMGLHPKVIEALTEADYKKASSIQIQAIPPILKSKDLLAIAATGTGKTAAFAAPILSKLAESPRDEDDFNKVRALILAPTRELGGQAEPEKVVQPFHFVVWKKRRPLRPSRNTREKQLK